MQVWTIANQKGGVGKTTTTVTLGGLLAEKGKRVLLIDTDPHASLTYYFGVDSEQVPVSAYDIFTQGAQMDEAQILHALQRTKYENIDILPATMAIATLDRALGNQQGMGLILKKVLAKIARHYDYALLDCPPVLGVLMVNALAASQRVIIPVQTEFLALKGLERMMRTMELMRQSAQEQNYEFTIVATLFDKRTKASLSAYQKLRDTYGDDVWTGVVPVDTKFRDASHAQQVPSEHTKHSRGVQAYRALLGHILRKGRES